MSNKKGDFKNRNESPDPIYTFKGNQTQIHSLGYLINSNEEKLLAGARDGKVHIWDFQTRRQVDVLQSGKSGSCISILTLNNQEIITHSRGKCINVWGRREDGKWTPSGTLIAPGNEYCGAELINIGSSCNDSIIYPAGDGSNLRVANPQTNKVLFDILITDKNLGNVMELKSAGHNLILSLFETGYVLLWDARNYANPIKMLSLGQNTEESFSSMCMTFEINSRRGVVGSSNNILANFCIENDYTLNALPSTDLTNSGIAAMSFRGDGKLIASAGWDSRVRLFSLRTNFTELKSPLRPLAVLDSYTENKSLQCVAFSPSPIHALDCKSLLAAAGEACSIIMWDIYN